MAGEYELDKVRALIGDPLAVARGKFRGMSVLHKFGRNAAVGTTAEPIWSAGGTSYPGFLTAADTVVIRAGGNAGDDAAGAGAREVTVQGLNANFELVTEAIATNGATESSPTTNSFIRVFRAWVSETGTYGGSNIGAINIDTDGGTHLAQIAAGEGQTQMAIYTVPADHELYIVRLSCSVGGNSNDCIFDLIKRSAADVTSAPGMGAPRLQHRVEAVDSGTAYTERFDAPLKIEEKSDVWIEGTAGGTTIEVTANWCGFLVNTLEAGY